MLVSNENYVEAFAQLADPNDPGSIEVLVDFVLQHNNAYLPPFADEIEQSIKTRLLSTEIGYRQGERLRGEEQALVDMWNSIASRFGLPEPALTSLLQVRLVRRQESLSLPKLMQMEDINEAVSSVMSPLQAALVAKRLLTSKRTMLWYWAPPAEWDASRYEEGCKHYGKLKRS